MQKGVVRKRRPGQQSEYGRQLREKQDLKEQYNLREKQMRNYVQEVQQKRGSGDTFELLMRALETRLDSVVYRVGLAQTRKQARQIVTHGHMLVNGRSVDVPSLRVKKGDVIAVHSSSAKSTLFQHIKLALKNHETPSWIEFNKDTMEGTILTMPNYEEIAPTVELPLVFEFYSR